MQNRNQLVNELKSLLSRKQSKEYYAKRLNTTVAEITDMLNEIHNKNTNIDNQETFNTKRLNIEKGEIEINGYWKKEPTTEEIVKSHNIDSKEYTLSQYWSKQKSKGFQVSACFKAIKKDTAEYIQESFTEFLRTYKPTIKDNTYLRKSYSRENLNACLIINAQDAHWNKYDVRGNNNIEDRFKDAQNKIEYFVRKTIGTINLERIVYIIGSDAFNSEHTGFTTHGTPQTNTTDYHKSFEAICNHELTIIDFLASTASNVDILYVPGNHDQYVGWNLVKWLQAYYRNQPNISITTDPKFTKYIKYSNTALAFSHGYKQKPEVLATNFPMEFKEFSLCDNHYIFAGDLHTELSKTIGGITYYRLAQTSKAISNWDDENGYTLSKGKMTAFLITENEGLTDIMYK